MERIEVSANFMLDEFVDPRSYFSLADHGKSLVDPKIIDVVQLLRVKKGSSININTWWKLYLKKISEGWELEDIIPFLENSRLVSKWSGFRPENCPIGAKYSQHKKGNAVDPKGDEYVLYQIVEYNAAEFYAMGLRRLEDPDITNGWLHMDLSEKRHKENNIRVINNTSFVRNIPIAV